MESKPRYRRILLKLSGEALGGQRDEGIDFEVVRKVASQVKRVRDMGVEIALVVGGGNIFRGLARELALQDGLEKLGLPARTMSAIQMNQVAEPYIRRRAVRHLEKGRVVLLAGGNGNPYFTTDTTAALRAVELEAEVVMKATKVDGVYTADPFRDPTATKFQRLDYMEVLNRGIDVMDNTALTLCMDNGVPIVVFDMLKEGNMERVVCGDPIGTLVATGA